MAEYGFNVPCSKKASDVIRRRHIFDIVSPYLEATEVVAARGKKEAKSGKKNLETRCALIFSGYLCSQLESQGSTSAW
jgi:hypothetical protein